MFAVQVCVGGCSDRRILRGNGTASAQVTPVAAGSVISDSLPEQAEDDKVTVLLVDAGTAEFNQLRSNRLERAEIKLLFAVVAQILCCGNASLQAIGADDFTSWDMLHKEMVAHSIERVGIQAGSERLGQPLIQFEIEDGEAQRLGGANFRGALGQATGVD